MKNTTGVGALGNLSLTVQFPSRPGHGTQGRKIAVYANYLQVKIPEKMTLTRYNVEVAPEAKGKKLSRVFQLLLEDPQFAGVGTEFKSMIISPQPLNIPDGHEVQIQYRADGEDEPLPNAVVYKVRIVTPTSLAVSDLDKYLSATNSGPAFPQKLETIQALNAIFGHHPQCHNEVVSIGQNRHFSIDRSPQNSRNIHVLGGGLESLRGYFQSIRPATGGILLNVNVTHGVFLEPIRLSDLFLKLGTGNLNTLQKKLKLVRVKVIHLPAKKSKFNKEIPRVKTIFALAHPQDGRSEPHPPQVASFGAGPKGVKFYLSAAEGKPEGGDKTKMKPKKDAGPLLPTNTYISVFDYFRKSGSDYAC